MYDPQSGEWREWRLPGRNPQPYAVYVDELDQVWLSDFGANALVRFDPELERFEVFPLPGSPANVRQVMVNGTLHGVDELLADLTENQRRAVGAKVADMAAKITRLEDALETDDRTAAAVVADVGEEIARFTGRKPPKLH
ncbi:hypothetical protein B4Q13_24955 [Lacticaseibacillus rhamnosus]